MGGICTGCGSDMSPLEYLSGIGTCMVCRQCGYVQDVAVVTDKEIARLEELVVEATMNGRSPAEPLAMLINLKAQKAQLDQEPLRETYYGGGGSASGYTTSSGGGGGSVFNFTNGRNGTSTRAMAQRSRREYQLPEPTKAEPVRLPPLEGRKLDLE